VRDAALADGEAGPVAEECRRSCNYVSAHTEEFEAAAARHATQLATALADGSFEPHPVTRVQIPKPSGGIPKLAVPALPTVLSSGCFLSS
jgi:hypothetical protein